MLDNLRYGLLLVGIFLVIVVLIILRKGRMPIKYALIWLAPAIIIILLAIIPEMFLTVANIFGFEAISSLVVGVLFLVLIFIIMAMTVIIAGINTKIIMLIQEVSILKKEINRNDK